MRPTLRPAEDGCWRVAGAGPAQISECRAGVVHDLRNMLQIAVSAVSATKRRLLQSPEAQSALTLDHALEALERVEHFASYLSMSSLETKATTIVLQTFLPGMQALIQQALGHRIGLEFLIAQDLQTLTCNRHELESAVMNLVLNARDAMPRGGTLKIEALACARCADEAKCNTLSVIDNGHGMSPEISAEAFDLHFTTKQSSGGSGIGLHNVRLFTQSLGGFVELVTAPQAGTRVCLHLPREANNKRY